MRHEVEIRVRLQAGDAEVRALAETIRHLQYRVKDGAPGWQDALQELAAHCERRRTLEGQLESLRWVLAAGGQLPV